MPPGASRFSIVINLASALLGRRTPDLIEIEGTDSRVLHLGAEHKSAGFRIPTAQFTVKGMATLESALLLAPLLVLLSVNA
jgi:hypothetical protein